MDVMLTEPEAHFLHELMDALSDNYKGPDSIRLRELIEEGADAVGYSPEQVQAMSDSIFEKTKG